MGLGGAGWWMGSGWVTSCYPYSSAPLQSNRTCSAHPLLLYQHQLNSCQPLLSMPGPEVSTDAYTSLAASGSHQHVILINKGIWLLQLVNGKLKLAAVTEKLCKLWTHIAGFKHTVNVKNNLIGSYKVGCYVSKHGRWFICSKPSNSLDMSTLPQKVTFNMSKINS